MGGVCTDLMSISLLVVASRTMSLMHGGGVIGRRSCRQPDVLVHILCHLPTTLSRAWTACLSYLVSEAAHTSSNGLLNDFQAAQKEVSSTKVLIPREPFSYTPVYPIVLHGRRTRRFLSGMW